MLSDSRKIDLELQAVAELAAELAKEALKEPSVQHGSKDSEGVVHLPASSQLGKHFQNEHIVQGLLSEQYIDGTGNVYTFIPLPGGLVLKGYGSSADFRLTDIAILAPEQAAQHRKRAQDLRDRALSTTPKK